MTQEEAMRTALARKTVVCVGLGGARSYVENLARLGVGRFVLLDGDRAEVENLRTQAIYPDEAGGYKACLVAAQLRRIHPTAHIAAMPRFLDDTMDDSAFAALLGTARARPRDVLLAGCTDSFPAQARTAALALQFGTPYLAAQLYREGLAGELFFSYPGVTTGGCARCALESRYQAYARGFQNDVSSQGANVFATERLNALKGTISLALLLHGEPDVGRYSTLLTHLRTHHFALLRLSPDAGSALGIPALASTGDTPCFDDTRWIAQHPNHPRYGEARCPLCGGADDLRTLAGTFADTRSCYKQGGF